MSATALSRLLAMGFEDEAASAALTEAGGDLEAATLLLLEPRLPVLSGHHSPAAPPPPLYPPSSPSISPPAPTRARSAGKEAAAAGVAEATLLVGRRVAVSSLTCNQEFNTRRGTVIGTDRHRYLVEIDGVADEPLILSVLEENLIPIEACEPPPAPPPADLHDDPTGVGVGGSSSRPAAVAESSLSEEEQLRVAIAESLRSSTPEQLAGSSLASAPRFNPTNPPPPPPYPPPNVSQARARSVERFESVLARQAMHEAAANALLERVRCFCRETQTSFTDPDFPPADSSLYLDGKGWAVSDSGSARHRAGLEEIVWLRPHSILPRQMDEGGETGLPYLAQARLGLAALGLSSLSQPNARSAWEVVRGTPLPHDIRQGALGDCWLLSALALIAERPRLLAAVLPAQKPDPWGAYHVRLCSAGQWRTLLVDDCLPCVPISSGALPFAREQGFCAFGTARHCQLWVALIEKAMAKLHGSYESLEGGTVDEALRTLTGFPTTRMYLVSRNSTVAGPSGARAFAGGSADSAVEDPDLQWARLLSFFEAGFLCGASCGSGDGGAAAAAAAEAMGLLSEHAYSVLDVRAAAGARLIKLRNPWGRLEWRGDWSDDSPLWTLELRRELGHEVGSSAAAAADDGVFWMCWDDFRDYFSAVDVCRVRPDWAEVRASGAIGGALAGGMRGFKLEVLKTTEAEFSLLQPSGRGHAVRVSGRARDPDGELTTDLLLLVLELPKTSQGDSGGAGARVGAMRSQSVFKDGDTGGPSAQSGEDRHERSAGSALRLLACSERVMHEEVTCEVLLAPGSYLVLPVSLRPGHSTLGWPQTVLRIGSALPLLCDEVDVSDANLAAAVGAYARRGTRHRAFEGTGMDLYRLQDGCGWLLYAENRSRLFRFTVGVDLSESFNLLASRGALATQDAVPPGSGQLLQVLSLCGKEASMLNCRTHFQQGPPVGIGMHIPCIESEVHRPFALLNEANTVAGANKTAPRGRSMSGKGRSDGTWGSGGLVDRFESRLRGLGFI